MDNTKTTQKLTQQQKDSLFSGANQHVAGLKQQLQTEADNLFRRAQEHRTTLKEFADIDIDDAASDDAFKELAIAKVQLLEGMAKDLLTIKEAPYFIRIDVVWNDTGESETLLFGKRLYKPEGIYSWVSPISTLRYAEIGEAEYERPDGTSRAATIHRKDNFLITKGEIVFMTHEDNEYDRQVVFQKHMSERKEFLLPEIVAELDKLQDQIIRSDPKGPFLISGPAGSGKTTLALHRVAYLVLTPEFKDYFDPERILVFVSNESDVSYFSKLLPELGIEGVAVTTFGLWATLVVNSRYTVKSKDRFKLMPIRDAEAFIEEHNPTPQLPPRMVLDEYRKLKQELIHGQQIREGKAKEVYPTLHSWYLDGITHLEQSHLKQFKNYLEFQKQNKYLDEVDLIILLKSLENPPKQRVHVVVDEVQNWLPAQLELVSGLATRVYNSVSYIGDIRQKTKAFTVNGWEEVSPEFTNQGPRTVELLKVYRNSNPILKHLIDLGYDVSENPNKPGGKVEQMNFNDIESAQQQAKLIAEKEKQQGKQVAILAKYRSSLDGLEYLGHADEQVHILTIEDAQGLEFDTVVIIDVQILKQDYTELDLPLSMTSKQEYTDQNKHLYYVAATRAKQDLYLLSQTN